MHLPWLHCAPSSIGIPCTAPSTSAPPTPASPLPAVDDAGGRCICWRTRARPPNDADGRVLRASKGWRRIEAPRRLYGRAAMAAYVDGQRRPPDALDEEHPRLDAGSSRRTDVGAGHAVRYVDVIAGYLRHLKHQAQAHAGRADHAGRARSPGVLRRRRPGARRQGAGGAGGRGTRGRLRRGALPVRADRCGAGLRSSVPPESSSCWWPTSAAAPPTSRWCASGPNGARGSSGATTSWPTTACMSPAPTSTATSSWPASCRPAATGPGPGACADEAPREVPSRVYFDLATWHLINTVYIPAARGRTGAHARLLRRRTPT